MPGIKMNNIRWVSLLALLYLFGCSEVIDLKTTPGPSQLLVFGRITSGQEGNLVEIARTSPIDNKQSPVESATVTLVSDSGEREEYRSVGSGIYQLFNQVIKGEPGRTYYLEISLTDGSLYRSVPAQMPQRVASDALEFESNTVTVPGPNLTEIRRNFVEFYMTTQMLRPGEDAFIRWNLVETYLFPEQPQMVNVPDPPPQWCYITEDVEEQQVLLFNGRDLKVDEISKRLITRRLADHAFVSRYYLQVVQSSLTSDAFRFWDELDRVANAEGSIFERPLGPVSGNLYNVNDAKEQVLGYFEVSKVDTTRILVMAQDTPYDIRPFCPLFGQVGPECLNCLLLDNTVKVKPYFVD